MYTKRQKCIMARLTCVSTSRLNPAAASFGEKVGKISEGYGPDVAAEIRADRIKAIRHGEEVKTAKELRREQAEKDKPFAEIADAYFDIKGPTLKGLTTDRNRYLKHLKPLFGKRSVSKITPQMVEELRKSLSERKPATLWNTLELLRRIINFGVKTNRCPNLAFQIEMPVKDNEVIEHLTPEETCRFLDCARTWPARDVGNMLLLAFFTGMRRGEMFKLQDEDVAFDLKLIRLRDPKGRKTLSIGMSSLVEELLQEQMAWRDEHFPGSPMFSPAKTARCAKTAQRLTASARRRACRPSSGPSTGCGITLP